MTILNEDLNVKGDSNLEGTLTVDKDATLNKDLNVKENTNIDGTLSVDKEQY